MTKPPAISNTALVEELRGRLWLNRAALLRMVTRTDEELATLEAHQAGSPVEDAASGSPPPLRIRKQAPARRPGSGAPDAAEGPSL